MADVALNWSSAEVKDWKLKVPLEGDIAPGWKRAFEMTDRLLGGGDWGEVRVKKQTVRIHDVTPGSEEKLGHHLKSVVEQANATVRDTERADEETDEPERDHDSADARMTESFRAFAKDSEAARSAG
jgi:hypothetical protein